jgi:hypothetical protein
VVALDMAGDPALDDLAIATCWEDPPSDSRLYASAWNGITASNLYEVVAGESGPLTHGNRARLSSTEPWLVGMMQPTGTTSEFITRVPGTLGYDVGPSVTGLPPDATWVWGEFAGPGHSQFLFYGPGESTLYVRPVEEATPGVFSFGSGAAFDLGQAIRQVYVLPQSTGALLLVVFGDGSTAGIYDFDGTNAPGLRQLLTAPPGDFYSLAGPLGDGNLLLLSGPAGGAGASTGWERWAFDGVQHTLAGSGALPSFTPGSGRANVFVYGSDPAVDPDAEVQLMFQVGDWSVAADTVHAVLDVTAETFVDSTSGLGNATVTSVSRGSPGFYVFPGLNEVCATVNQLSASSSVACLSPAFGIPMGEVTFDPPPGVYAPAAGGGLTVRLTATPDGPVHFRTDPSQPWTLYSAADPPTITANATLWAYADNRVGFWYYDYTDYDWHYADSDAYTPVRTATYTITAPPALEPAPQTDANGDGLGDAWATAFGITDPLADPDGDGANNRAEFAAGTDPLDAASAPSLGATHTVTFQPGAHGALAGGTPAVTVTVNDGDPAPAAPTVAPDMGWSFTGWSPPLPASITADAETTAQYAVRPNQADQNDDWRIQLSPELTRLIQFYNLRGYHCQGGTEDGYAPGAPGADPEDTACGPHQADQNRDWAIQLSPELTRMIQFYNSGGYHTADGTEDGYAPGPAPGKAPSAKGYLTATREMGAGNHAARGALDVVVTLTHSAPATLTSLAVQETLPAGWAFLGVVDGPAPEIAPAAGTAGSLGFAWINLPATWPVRLAYRVSAPAGTAAAGSFGGSVAYRAGDGEVRVPTSASQSEAEAVAGPGWFDLSGSYATAIAGDSLELDVVHDARGRLTGRAVLLVSTGKERVPVALPVRGRVSGSDGALVATVALRGRNDTGTVRVSLALDLALDAAALQLEGRATGSILIGAADTGVSQAVALVLPASMDGTWTLAPEPVPPANDDFRAAVLTLSNGVAHRLAVTGRPGGPKAAVDLAGQPPDAAARGIRIMAIAEATADGRTRLTVLSARGYGQRFGR